MPPVAVAVGAAVVGAFGTTVAYGTAMAIGAAVIGVGVAGVAGLTAHAMKPKIPAAVGASGSTLDFKADPGAPIPYVIGRTAVGGSIVHLTTYGPKNSYLTYFTVLGGGGPYKSADTLLADDEPVTFAGQAATGRYAGQMWRAVQLGAAGAAALMAPTVAGGHTPADWTAAHKLSGYCAEAWTLKYDSSEKTPLTSTPKSLRVVEGAMVYDPRLDSTYPGGAGGCRALDESTYVYSENPFLHGLTWCLGRWQNGVRVLGVGAPVAAIDVAAFVEGANVCDANGWKVGGQVSSADFKKDVLDAMLAAGGGWSITSGSYITCQVQTPRVSLDTVGAGDIVGRASVTAVQPRRERINRVSPRYRSEAHKWETVAAGTVTVPEYVQADGGERTREIEYGLVQNAKQAAELARYTIEDGREIGPIVLPLKPRWMGVEPGDCITVDEPELGLNGQKVLVLRRQPPQVSGVVTLECRSETDGKHPFALGQVASPPPARGLTGIDLRVILAPAANAWTATAGVAAASNLPTIFVRGASDNPNATGIIVEYREAADGSPWTLWTEGPPTSTAFDIGLPKSKTSYRVGVSYRTRGGVGTRLELAPVLTGEVLADDLGPGATIGGRPVDELIVGLDTLGDLGGFADNQRRLALDTRDTAWATLGGVMDVVDEIAARREGVTGAFAFTETTRDFFTNELRAETYTRETQASFFNESLSFADEQITTLATEQGAETNRRRTDVSQLGDALAVVQETAQTSVTEVLARTVTQQSQISAFGNNIASVQETVTTEATASRAFTETVRQQVGAVGDSLGVVEDRVTTDVTAVRAFTETVRSQVSVTGASLAAAEQRITTETTNARAFTESVRTQVSQVGASIAGAEERITTEANAYSARTLLVERAIAAVGDNIAAVEQTIDLLVGPDGKPTALFEVVAQATGSRPALLRLFSGGGSSNIALMAAEIFFGDNTVFDDATNTFQTVANGKRFIFGGPFSTEGLVMWLGDQSHGADTASRGNANFYVATTSPRIGGTDFPTGGGGAGAVRRRATASVSGSSRINAVDFGSSGAALLDLEISLGNPTSAANNTSGFVYVDQGEGNSWFNIATIPFTITSEGSGIYSINADNTGFSGIEITQPGVSLYVQINGGSVSSWPILLDAIRWPSA